MNHILKITLGTLIVLLSACGEDRSGEYYALIEDKMWIEETMQKHYLWYDQMPVTEKEADYFKEAGIEIMSGGWDFNYPNALSGHDPFGCNERIGKAALRFEAERLANAIKVLKEDENLWRWHTEMWETK